MGNFLFTEDDLASNHGRRRCCQQDLPHSGLGRQEGRIFGYQGTSHQGDGDDHVQDGQARPRQGALLRNRHFHRQEARDLCPSTHNMEAPNVKRTDLPLTDIDDEDYLQLMEEDGTLKSNLQLPEGDLGKEIRDAFDNDDGAEIICTVQEAMGEEMVVAWKFDK